VNRLGAGLLADGKDFLNVEIALGGQGRAEQERLVGGLDVQRLAVRLRIDGDRSDAHFAQGPYDANRYLAAISDEDFLEHEDRQYFSRSR
jgi:hypothetical protein